MLAALLHDLSKSAIGAVTTLVHPSLDAFGLEAHRIAPVTAELWDAVAREMQNHDAVWIIAPETGGILREFTRLAESLGKKVIGSSSAAVETCGDKLLAHACLKKAVEMPDAEEFHAGYRRFPCVVKPVDGAGCENTFLLNNRRELLALELPDGRFMIQPYVEGEAMSAAAVTRNDETVLLGVSMQKVEAARQMRFSGVRGPVMYAHRGKIETMVLEIKEKIPGLGGYWGIDFVDYRGEPVLIEINPRLTSSYPVYSAASPFNIARYAALGER